MPRRLAIPLAAVVAVLVVAGGLLGFKAQRSQEDSAAASSTGSPTGSLSAPSPSSIPAPTTVTTFPASPTTLAEVPVPTDEAEGYYLALGDSLATGFQLGVDRRTEGYAGPVRTAVEKREGPTELVNLGCSGETTTSMLRGGSCSYAAGSQLEQAEQFLREHAEDTHLVTLDVGGNDVAHCGFGGLEPQCTKPALATLSANLPTITSRLRAAAPDTQIVVLNYYDPFLVLDLAGSPGLGQKSVVELAKVNQAIARSATAGGAQLADVATAFQTRVTAPTTVTDVGRVPTNLARILQWTWMAPPRFDFHPNDKGYAVMARAVQMQLR